MDKLESKFQAQVLRWLEENVGGHWINLVISALHKKGEPDIIGVKDGRFYAFELKVKNKKPTKLQKHKLEKIKQNGGIAMVIRNICQLEKLFNEGEGEE